MTRRRTTLAEPMQELFDAMPEIKSLNGPSPEEQRGLTPECQKLLLRLQNVDCDLRADQQRGKLLRIAQELLINCGGGKSRPLRCFPLEYQVMIARAYVGGQRKLARRRAWLEYEQYA